jgi:hypothetical protein
MKLKQVDWGRDRDEFTVRALSSTRFARCLLLSLGRIFDIDAGLRPLSRRGGPSI